MSEINPVGRPELNGVHANQNARQQKVQATQQTSQQREDRVQVSDHARLLSKLRENPIRQDLVSRVRQEIDQGTYETADKVDRAIDELRADLD